LFVKPKNEIPGRHSGGKGVYCGQSGKLEKNFTNTQKSVDKRFLRVYNAGHKGNGVFELNGSKALYLLKTVCKKGNGVFNAGFPRLKDAFFFAVPKGTEITRRNTHDYGKGLFRKHGL